VVLPPPEAVPVELGVTDGVLDILVSEPKLQVASVPALEPPVRP